MREIRRGDIWWAELPSEGSRPVLVMTRNDAIPVLHRVVVAPITRTVRDIPTEVPLGPDDGLPIECAASFDNVRVVPKSLLVRRVSSIAHRMPEACHALAAVVDC